MRYACGGLVGLYDPPALQCPLSQLAAATTRATDPATNQ